MTDVKKQFEKEIDDLKRLRDELRVQAHLAKAELKDSWEHLEQRWPEVDERIRAFESQASGAINETAKSLVSEFKSAYQKLKSELK